MQGTERNEADPMRGGSCMIIPREVDLHQSFTAMCCATIMFQQQWPCTTFDFAPLLHVVVQMLADAFSSMQNGSEGVKMSSA